MILDDNDNENKEKSKKKVHVKIFQTTVALKHVEKVFPPKESDVEV